MNPRRSARPMRTRRSGTGCCDGWSRPLPRPAAWPARSAASTPTARRGARRSPSRGSRCSATPAGPRRRRPGRPARRTPSPRGLQRGAAVHRPVARVADLRRAHHQPAQHRRRHGRRRRGQPDRGESAATPAPRPGVASLDLDLGTGRMVVPPATQGPGHERTTMLTIGEFAQATGLTAKALRLYDDLGLLAPADVDERTGYRRYTPDQVDRARLVARLRSAGVPLRRIATIVELDDREAAAAELLSYWRQVEADTASARQVVATLVSQMRGHDTTMEPTTSTTPHGRPPAPPTAPGRAVASLDLDRVYPRDHRSPRRSRASGSSRWPTAYGSDERAADAALDALEVARRRRASRRPAGRARRGRQPGPPRPWPDATPRPAAPPSPRCCSSATAPSIAHVGDSRAYVVRDGGLERLTRDHTVVQSLIDEGRLTEDEARADPDRALLNRALAPGSPAAPDLSVRQVLPGRPVRPDDRRRAQRCSSRGSSPRCCSRPGAGRRRRRGRGRGAGGRRARQLRRRGRRRLTPRRGMARGPDRDGQGLERLG